MLARFLRTPVAGLAALAALLGQRAATAQTTVHASGSATLSYTDNMLSTANDRISIWFLTLTPGIELYSDTARARYFLGYTRPYTLYFGRPEANTDADVGVARGIFTLSPRDELLLGVSAARITNTLAALQDQPPGAAEADGRSTLLRLGANETLTHQYTQNWTGRQLFAVGAVVPIDTEGAQPNRYTFDFGLGADYSPDQNSYGLDLNGTYFTSESVRDGDGNVVEGQRMVIGSAIGRYRRDLSVTFSSELRGGVAVVNNLEGRTAYQPSWGASLFYNPEYGEAALNYDHTVNVDLITNQVFLSDALSITGGLPIIPAWQVLLLTQHGLSFNRIISSDADVGRQSSKTWSSSVGVGWFPDNDLPQWQVRYTHFEQFDTPRNSAQFPSFVRNLVSFSVSGRFPPRTIGEIPDEPAQRVDGADRAPTTPGISPPGAAAPVDLAAPDEGRVPE